MCLCAPIPDPIKQVALPELKRTLTPHHTKSQSQPLRQPNLNSHGVLQEKITPKNTKPQSSPLLNLPREIRNQIYVLVFSTGLRDTIDFTRGSKDRHINRLQHACRQLHRETRLLEIKLNPVEIAGFAMHTHYKLLDNKDPMEALTVFLRLTRALGSLRLSWIQNLTLSNRIPEVDSMWNELEEMASTILHLTEVFGCNPALQLKYNMTTFCKVNILREGIGGGLGLGVIFHGIFVSSVVRNEPLKDM
ncbi:uncharacterized protein ALTATR162_LOCUS11581 [Alternaria atra]|jgi:hypothetical protein|uniref:F-box domain-containing protein n=1 Tax=Alternaria atra TaxID=119953 RepID=A0A8J2IBH5_9PLEO|nr:uncharacterized protein ALTATR162_LOCUS11581 [Alternaria atra]CAG5186422.1 unnamed protein product [Alternaria atra]